MLAYVKWWVNGFSNKGLPSYVLDGSMPRITKRANRYLRILSDGDITMDFQTQRLLKSDKKQVRDDIEITTTIEGNEGVTPSSGQLTKMNLATDLALMDLVAKREGQHLDLLMLDEVLDGLDAEGTDRVLKLLQVLRRKRGSIFVISHGAEMSEVFEHGLKVIKENGAATVKKVA
jgi:DNA repair exonuclease SbcCD ATPase subunit